MLKKYTENSIVCCFPSRERDEAGFSDMISEIWKLKQRCGHVSNIYVDAANPEIWQALKKEFNEPLTRRTTVCKPSLISYNQILHRGRMNRRRQLPTECSKYSINIVVLS